MKDYTEALATRLLATNCVICGRKLVDAISCELGVGPECRDGIYPEGIDDSDRKIANEHVFHAAIAAQRGQVEKVLEYAELILKLGFTELAEKVSRRFMDGAEKVERDPDITIEETGDVMVVKTPFRRGAKDEFINAWRQIPGRRFDRQRLANVVPKTSKAAVWGLLREFFPGKWGRGPKGVFRVPVVA